jgi:hypothetical protein
MEYQDYDNPEFYKVRYHKARRPWTCDGCKKERPAGVVYEYAVCKMPGETFETRKSCKLDINHDCPFD